MIWPNVLVHVWTPAQHQGSHLKVLADQTWQILDSVRKLQAVKESERKQHNAWWLWWGDLG